MWTEPARSCKTPMRRKGLRRSERDFASGAVYSPPALNMVAVTRLRPECLLR